MVYGHEMGDKEGTSHLQGYVYLHNQSTLTALKKRIGIKEIHLEGAKGSPEQNFDYCTKQDTENYYERGIRPKQGRRTDLTNINQEIHSGTSMRALCEKDISLQGIKHAEALLKYVEQPRPIGLIEVIWIHGPTGTGKTKYVYNHYNDIFRPISFKWWEGYDAHETVLIDEFRKDFCKFHQLLSPLLDIYPFRVETKGGSRQARYNTLIITSCYHPAEVYDTREDVHQLLRRITKRIFIKKKNVIQIYTDAQEICTQEQP